MMTMDRKSKRVHWEIMIQLEEAGEEDLCGLLNEVMSQQPYYGTGTDLCEFLTAIESLQRQGEIKMRGYRLQGESTDFFSISSEPVTNLHAELKFNSGSRFWEWTDVTRQMVELPDR